jgi:hypothetical protein
VSTGSAPGARPSWGVHRLHRHPRRRRRAGGKRNPAPFLHFDNQTLRQFVHTSIGGRRVRVILSNAFGTAPLAVGAAHIRDSRKELGHRAGIRPRVELRRAANDRDSRGATVFSDPVSLRGSADGRPRHRSTCPATRSPRRRSRCTPTRCRPATRPKRATTPASPRSPVAATLQNWFVLSRVEVTAPESVHAVVTFGASLTDGAPVHARHEQPLA